ncbi:MAG: phosphoribosylformylglycinamidine synthase subunit PurL, partial [Planctomycetota bacterium]
MIWRIEVALKKQFNDPEALGLVHDAADLGITLEAVRFVRVYTVESDMTPKQAERVAGELIADPVTDRVSVNKPLVFKDLPDGHIIEVFRKPGVMDPVESSTLLGIRDMGLDAQGVATARKYIVSGKLEQKDLETVAGRILANAAIEDVAFSQVDPKPRVPAEPYELKVTTVDLLGASDSRLKQISRDMTLSLSLEEMQVIRDHFKSLDRNPTDVELETLAQTWSEHCVHKTFRGHVEMDDGTVIHNLLKQTVFKVTRELDRTWCVSVFHDNAGVIRFNKDYDLAFKAETHNHPSAIEPYGGAGTGIGGVIRDILGVGLGARPIFNTDVFCFGSPDMPQSDVPTGAMHPKRVMKGVVSGVRDYGNRMGIPTINGAVCFDDRFTGNPLVYCGTAGLIPRGKSKKAARKGDLVVVAGGRTGRDGIHGATFSSDELHEESETVSSGAVQIGNPITEKKVTDMLLVARDRELYTAVTDCGAGGLSSAVGEMGETLGAEVHLERVPLKYEGLSYTEIWISEAQERMVFSVPPQHERELHELFASENVESVTIGHFTGDGRLKLFYEDEQVCDIDMTFLHDGVPMITRKAVFKPKKHRNPAVAKRTDLTDELKAVLSRGNVASKEWIIRQYDHEVQGSSILKPLVGARADGPGDASVVAPVLGSSKGVVVGCGINPKYSDIDPYWMAASVIDEALRNVVAVGGSVDRTALLDNFCWGNTNKPDRMGGFVRAAQACYDVAKVYRTPFISGKDSLNNEFKTASGTVAIPGTLLVSAITLIDDVSRAVTMDLKTPGNLLVAVGATKDELGASEYYAARGAIGNNVPKLNPKGALTVLQAVESAIRKRLVRSCHDLGDGGLAVGLAEMAFAGDLGAEVALTDVPRTDEVTRDEQVLFSESNSRFVLEVTPKKLDRLMAQLSNVPAA